MKLIVSIGVVILYLLLVYISGVDIMLATRSSEVWSDIVTIAIGAAIVTFVLLPSTGAGLSALEHSEKIVL